MADTGVISPGTGANDTGVGTVAWNSPSNILTANSSYAFASFSSSATSNYLKATNFGFAIPSGATIDGIIVEFRRIRSNFHPITDTTIKLVKGGVVGGSNLSAGAAWTTSLSYVSFGGASNLWGNTLTDADVNASNFGVVLSVSCVHGGGKFNGQAQVDHVRMTVYYTEGGGESANTSAFFRMF